MCSDDTSQTPEQEAPIPAEPQRKPSPYDNSPFESYFDTASSAPEAPKAPKEPRRRRTLRPALGALAAVGVLLGACGATYGMGMRSARSINAQTTAQLQQQIDALQKQLDTRQQSDGVSRSGSGAPQEGLTPGQVYARNVDSVVAISCDTDLTIGGQTVRSTVSGSGFILSADGYVATNYHVVENAQAVTVTTQAGNDYEASIVGHDSTADMAVLKVDAENLPAVTLGSSAQLIIGDMVVAIGNPLGTLNATQTVGYISGINREVNTEKNVTTMLQTDAAINSGNSGGPLFNMNGEVVGIITAKYSGSSSSGASIEGIGFAIPIDDLKKSLEDLQTQGYIRSAYLGITGMDVSEEAVNTYGLPSGAYVETVVPGGPADKAGLQSKDIITALGGTSIDSFNALARALRSFVPGDETSVTVYRSGKELTFSIILAEKPREEDTQNSSQNIPSEGNFEEWFNYFNRKSDETP